MPRAILPRISILVRRLFDIKGRPLTSTQLAEMVEETISASDVSSVIYSHEGPAVPIFYAGPIQEVCESHGVRLLVDNLELAVQMRAGGVWLRDPGVISTARELLGEQAFVGLHTQAGRASDIFTQRSVPHFNVDPEALSSISVDVPSIGTPEFMTRVREVIYDINSSPVRTTLRGPISLDLVAGIDERVYPDIPDLILSGNNNEIPGPAEVSSMLSAVGGCT